MQCCFSEGEIRALAGHLLAAGGLCCSRPRSKSPEVFLWRNTNWGSPCCSPDNCPHCAAGQLWWPAGCHLACAETVTCGQGPAEEEKEGRDEKEGPAATAALHVLSFHAGIKSAHDYSCRWFPGSQWQLLLCKASWLLCSKAPPALHSLPFSWSSSAL